MACMTIGCCLSYRSRQHTPEYPRGLLTINAVEREFRRIKEVVANKGKDLQEQSINQGTSDQKNWRAISSVGVRMSRPP